MIPYINRRLQNNSKNKKFYDNHQVKNIYTVYIQDPIQTHTLQLILK